MKSILRTLALALLLAALGCTGSAEKGKNKDKDVPRTSEPAAK